MCESKLHDENTFVTLTYENDPYTLNKSDIKKFIRKLRDKTGEKIRFYQCGEYGERHFRPHHHCLLFGYRFPDEELWPELSKSGEKQYVSGLCNEIWGHGLCWLGKVTFDSAAYVAGYVTKKYTNRLEPEKEEEHYKGREKEFSTMSRKPGIGAGFVDRYFSDIYGGDFCLTRNGVKLKPPRYFDERARKTQKDVVEQIKEDRKVKYRYGQKINLFELDTMERVAKINQKRNRRDFYEA